MEPKAFWKRWANADEVKQLEMLETLTGVTKPLQHPVFDKPQVMTATLLRSYLKDLEEVPTEWGLKQARDRDRWMTCAQKRKTNIDIALSIWAKHYDAVNGGCSCPACQMARALRE